MEPWKIAWRDGFAPQLSTPALAALAAALATEALAAAPREDDPRLIRGATTSPPPIRGVGRQGEGPESVAQVEEFFARLCFEADQRLGEPAACRWLINWFNETPRDVMRGELLAEIALALAGRKGAAR